jgi:formate/nitrite transporter FocA (FNT family)
LDNQPSQHPTANLTEEEREDAKQRTSITAYIVHEAIRLDGEEELRRSSSALAWSGLAASLSMGFSMVAEALPVMPAGCAMAAAPFEAGLFTRIPHRHSRAAAVVH